MGSILFSDETIKGKVRGTFEVNERTGIEYRFGELLATNIRLVLYTRYPFGCAETTVYKYTDIIQVDIRHSLLIFNNDISIKANIVFLYKTNQYEGNLGSPKEGNVFWIPRTELFNYKLANDFEKMLEVFESEHLNEFYYDNGEVLLF